MPDEKQEHAQELFQQAYRAQMAGELDRAIELYKRSIEICPTSEAHTFLGWTYHFQGDTRAAIDECKRAIEVDPTFGNPYNDIGAYLIDLGRYDEAISWLEKAIRAPRYEPRQFPHFNLGRVYLAKGNFLRARQCFQEALRIEPDYLLAQRAIGRLRHMMN
ncbi:MAG TPA: tetratricopeptide repeat protein [Candidatus Dormibacteraeota bacterium]|nr:tetratricopeptide repeat protein [Candidatus Dormibacteraeota bacterium]